MFLFVIFDAARPVAAFSWPIYLFAYRARIVIACVHAHKGAARSALNAVVNGNLVQYPEVNSQRRVRTRLRAPYGQSLEVDFRGVPYPMTKGEDGFWIGVTNAHD